MTWRKLGLVFDPAAHPLPAGCVGFAQSPQVLPLADGLRVYFSARAVDPANGKYLSRPLWADLDDELRRVRAVAPAPALPPGGLGCFDEHGVFPLSPVRVGDEVWGYTTGWSRRVSVSVETGIGLAVSRDGGRTFARRGDGPVLSASLHEPCLVGDGFVRRLEGRFHMWYIFGTGWRREAPGAEPDRTYKIGHATSPDGIAWEKAEGRPIVADRLGPDECQALPSVVRHGGRYHLFFCWRPTHGFRTDPARGYRLGHAWSEDLSTWTRDDDLPGLEPTPGGWDSDMQCYPHAFVHRERLHLLYNGNAFGRHGFGLAVLG